MPKFKEVSPKPDFPKLEEKISKFWKENKIFEKAVENRPEDNFYSFLDGPPFVTGIPHYASLLPRIAKDLIPRFKTMQGHRVRHVWGWDCHGLPIEEKTEEKIGLKNRREIERYGVKKFINACHKYVDDISSEWGWYVDRIGEAVDMKKAYRTMDESYMESVIWVFKKLYDKGLVYEGVKTLLYCTRCGTPISKFEIAMDDSYKDMEDPAITVEFPITSKGKFKGARVLAWTTTPWTIPSNRGLVLDPKETYVEVESKEVGNKYITAKKRIKEIFGEDKFKVLKEFKGKELVGLSYQAPYDYFPPNKKDFKIYAYPGMVTMEEGTGIVHSAPGFGEVDTEMGQKYGLTTMFSVDDGGKFIDQVRDFKGMYIKKADKYIIEDLKKKGVLFKSKRVTHRFPYCYRCETPLIQRAQKSWFINIQKIKPLLLKQAKKINWHPAKFAKRFENNIKTAPDWCISRTRYWATAMPIWKCDKCEEIETFGSVKDIEKRSGQKVISLHRSGLDHIEFDCKKCKRKMKRVPEVLDCWLESGSMPYGQIHYPFENKKLFKETFPADYIVEYTGQLRAWFYCMHVISNALLEKNSFQNAVVTGVMWGNDGRKMSKSYKNFPDPKKTLNEAGGEALRLYFMGSAIMNGDDLIWNDKDFIEQLKNILIPFWNTYRYFVLYANSNNWKPKDPSGMTFKSTNILDRWLKSYLDQVTLDYQKALESYNIPASVKLIQPAIENLSTWWIRRSRKRFVAGDKEAIQTLYSALLHLIRTFAPQMPFLTEEFYQGFLVDSGFKEVKESIHLTEYPKVAKDNINRELIRNMEMVQKICSLGLKIRTNEKIRLRQPLSIAYVEIKDKALKNIVKEELNVKEVRNQFLKGKNIKVVAEGQVKVGLNIELTQKLREEGLYAEVIRTFQKARKKAGCQIGQKIATLKYYSLNKDLVQVILKNKDKIAKEIKTGEVLFDKELLDGKEFRFDEYFLEVGIN